MTAWPQSYIEFWEVLHVSRVNAALIINTDRAQCVLDSHVRDVTKGRNSVIINILQVDVISLYLPVDDRLLFFRLLCYSEYKTEDKSEFNKYKVNGSL